MSPTMRANLETEAPPLVATNNELKNKTGAIVETGQNGEGVAGEDDVCMSD